VEAVLGWHSRRDADRPREHVVAGGGRRWADPCRRCPAGGWRWRWSRSCWRPSWWRCCD